jgi:iron complex transport system ATP-binding protein
MLMLLSVDDRAPRTVATLSAGERQLVAIARTLAGAPPVIVLDEPVATLSREDRAAVLGALVGAREAGAAILCATAEEAWADALAAHGARRLKLEAGRIVGGTPAISLVPRRGHAAAHVTPEPRPKTPGPERVRGGS